MNDEIQRQVFAAIDLINAEMPKSMWLRKSPDAVLFGEGREIDSLGLVSLFAAVEDRVEREFGVRIFLENNQAPDKGQSRFLTLSHMIDRIAWLISNEGVSSERALQGQGFMKKMADISRQKTNGSVGGVVEKLIFIGAAPFAEQFEVIRDINAVEERFQVVGILDDNKDMHGKSLEGVRVLGPLDMLGDYPDLRIVLGIGTYANRTTLPEVIARLGLPLERYVTLVHPSAKVYDSARIGYGAIIHAGCIIGNETEVGSFAKVIWNAVVGARNVIGQGTTICPQAATGVDVRIGPFSFLGIASAIADGVTIGPMNAVGMGTIITRDTPPGAFSFGNPPRILSTDPVPEKLIENWDADLAGLEI